MAPPPRSLAQCVVGGKVYVVRFLQHRAAAYLRRRRTNLHKRLLRRQLEHIPTNKDECINNDQHVGPKERASRCVWGILNENGVKVPLRPDQSLWYMMYVNNSLVSTDSLMSAKFRQRFRIPYTNYLELVELCRADDRFRKWCGFKKNNKRASPIELLVLGALRYLGRGFTFDDIEECTAISREVHRCFFHKFVDFGRHVLYPQHVKFPTNASQAQTHMAEFTISGFPGCVGSSDCTHIATERCKYALRNQHIGQKSSHPTRSYSLTANHRRQILHTSSGGPGSWNDQTMVRHDNFVSGIHNGLYLCDVEFELKEYNREGIILSRKYKGGYLIVDNGYLRWSITVPPFKVTNRIEEIRWSKWVESMRKDVECTFGIMKGRFRILKTGIRMDGINAVDDIWFTCCALHNWLLNIDGLTGEWRDGVPVSDWEGSMGQHDDDYPVSDRVPNAVAQLHHNLNFRNYDLSGMGPGSDISSSMRQQSAAAVEAGLNEYDIDNSKDDDEDNDDDDKEPAVRVVRQLSLKYFRTKLVKHFAIRFHHNQLRWTIR
jgi:hypothetical protein